MARNVTYSVSPRINPRDKEAAPKYYGHVQASGDIDLREMSERIQATCTVHKSDVFAVLVALEDYHPYGNSDHPRHHLLHQHDGMRSKLPTKKNTHGEIFLKKIR